MQFRKTRTELLEGSSFSHGYSLVSLSLFRTRSLNTRHSAQEVPKGLRVQCGGFQITSHRMKTTRTHFCPPKKTLTSTALACLSAGIWLSIILTTCAGFCPTSALMSLKEIQLSLQSTTRVRCPLSLSPSSLPSPPPLSKKKIGKEVKRKRYPNGIDPILIPKKKKKKKKVRFDLPRPSPLGFFHPQKVKSLNAKDSWVLIKPSTVENYSKPSVCGFRLVFPTLAHS